MTIHNPGILLSRFFPFILAIKKTRPAIEEGGRAIIRRSWCWGAKYTEGSTARPFIHHHLVSRNDF